MYNKIKSIVGGWLIATISMFMVEGTDKAIGEEAQKFHYRLLGEFSSLPNTSSPTAAAFPSMVPRSTPQPSSFSLTSHLPSSKPTIFTPVLTAKPSMEPTVQILEPSSNPSSAPTVDTLSECETTFVHCGKELSTCFTDFVSDGSLVNRPWGWSIDLETVSLDECELTCALYAGASDCDYNQGTAKLLGIVVISENAVGWAIKKGYKAEEIHLYAGRCPYNDGGHYLTSNSSQVCDVEAMRQNAALYKTYPLANNDVSPTVKPVFDKLDNDSTEYRTQNWLDTDYHVFPLGGRSRRYLSAHATVCKVARATAVAKVVEVKGETNSVLAEEEGFPFAGVIGLLCALLLLVVVVGLYLHHKPGRIDGSSV